MRVVVVAVVEVSVMVVVVAVVSVTVVVVVVVEEDDEVLDSGPAFFVETTSELDVAAAADVGTSVGVSVVQTRHDPQDEGQNMMRMANNWQLASAGLDGQLL